MTRNKKQHRPSKRIKERPENGGSKPPAYPLVVDGESIPMHDPTKNIKRKIRSRTPTPPARGGNG